MRKNILIAIGVLLLFLFVFLLGNWRYFSTTHLQSASNGIAHVEEEQLQQLTQLNGEWSFYPNLLLPAEESLERYKDQRVKIEVPSSWYDYVQPNEEGLHTGTYHLKIEVPVDDQYGLYIRTIRTANRIFINGAEVGAKGNPSAKMKDFQTENDDKYIVMGQSSNKELDILIHVSSYTSPKAGIIYPIEFGTAQVIQRYFLIKGLLDILVSAGHIIFGVIYLITYIQNRRYKEELFFGLFMLLFGLYLSFINQKIFFWFVPITDASDQIRLQISILPLVLICALLFVFYMYPQVANRKIMYAMIAIQCLAVIFYGVFNSYDSFGYASSALETIMRKIRYIVVIGCAILYIIWMMVKVLWLRLEGARYIFIVFISSCLYATLLIINFLTGMPLDYCEFLLFILVLISLSSLLSYRSNRAYLKIQALSEELQTHDEMKNRFLLKTSQALRAPLNAISDVAKSLMEGIQGPLKREQQEQMILVHNVTQRMRHLVEDLLFSSSHTTGQLHISYRAVPVRVIHEVVKEFHSTMDKNSNLNLIAEVESSLPDIYTDELRFKQVLYNLLLNALQHTTIGKIVVRAFVESGYIVIQVEDTGSGIPEKDLEHIFNAFYQVPTNQPKEGLGLGLNIAKNIVEALNGDIQVASTLGVGTVFTVKMPIASMEQSIPEQLPAMLVATTDKSMPLIYRGNDKKIVLVDDDLSHMMILAHALIAKGYTVIAFDNGYDAIEYIKHNQVDCMLIDLLISGISSYELCKYIRKHYDMLELPIIILTTIMKHSDALLTLQAGANEYLQKPIDLDELIISINSLLAVRQSAIDAIEDEMNSLYTQITPHFVYNTLNTVIGLSYTDMDNAREALYCLATYFRAKLNVHYRNGMVSLEEEMELVKAYLSIEKMRFGEKLTVHYNIDESIQLMIPALSIQPLVENAVVHGISKKKDGGTIEISVQQIEQRVHLKIIDNGIGIASDKLQQLRSGKGQRIGFTNPFKKFQLMKQANLHIFSEEGQGTTILIVLSMEEKI
ncbi:ATP-binding protein [Bacillus ndiopicus]|uniref:ATP-binding protein n=1 Tax=Bacillus ndiopicus TaxID=1347368 RepID=UPI0005A8C583|nr:ATP-binding protein [Bacillus ndiopicus]